MMMAFSGEGMGGAKVEIREVRLLAADDVDSGALGTVVPRDPTIWHPESKYVPWDAIIPGYEPVKVTYDISVPDWSAVETELRARRDQKQQAAAGLVAQPGTPPADDTSSWGRMFVLEAEVLIDGTAQTVRSPEFVRRQPARIVT
jgi:hypothetical protein